MQHRPGPLLQRVSSSGLEDLAHTEEIFRRTSPFSANPVSNGMYLALSYEAVADTADVRLVS